MKRSLFLLALFAVSSAFAWTPLFSGQQGNRADVWYYDGSCPVSPLSEASEAFRIIDRLLTGVTFTYGGTDGTGHNYTDAKSMVSCHDQAWFNDGSGQYHKVSEANSGAFVDHSIVNGVHYFDLAINSSYLNSAPSIIKAMLHEGLHAAGLNHPPSTAANYWSAVYGCPFGGCGPANPDHWGWTDFPSNDDIVGLSDIYGHQPAYCEPYRSNGNAEHGPLWYMPYIPYSGSPNPNVSAGGYWAVLEEISGGNLVLVASGAATNYRYTCMLTNNNFLTITGDIWRESAGAVSHFTMTNLDSSGANKNYWSFTYP